MDDRPKIGEARAGYLAGGPAEAGLTIPPGLDWLRQLPAHERLEFLQALLAAVAAALAGGRWESLGEVVREWQRRTAPKPPLPADQTPAQIALDRSFRRILEEQGVDPDAPAPGAAEIRQELARYLPPGTNLAHEIVAMREE